MQVETNCSILFAIYVCPISLIAILPANFGSITHMYREVLFEQFVKPSATNRQIHKDSGQTSYLTLTFLRLGVVRGKPSKYIFRLNSA